MKATAAMRLGVGAALALVAWGAGAQNTGTSTEDLRYRLSLIDGELAQIRAQLGGGTAPVGGGSEVLARLDRLDTELRQLTGKLEKLEFEQRKVAQEAAKRFGDIEFRLTELEGGDTASLPPEVPLGTTGGTGATAGEVSVSEREALDLAIRDIEQGRFDQGEDRLRKFQSTYPGSPLQAEALFWQGESQFTRGAYQNAARSFLDGYNTDREGVEAARSLMRLGVTLGKLGQVSEACLTLREVGAQFPGAPADVLDSTDSEIQALNCG